jgi:hypothetical protein
MTTTPTDTLTQYSYDPRSMRYRNNNTGRYVTTTEVRAAVDQVIDAQESNFTSAASQLILGQITLADFQRQTAANIKTLHLATGLAANGGVNNAGPDDLAHIEDLINRQYEFLRNMGNDIETGKQPMDGRLLARVRLYAHAARGTYEDVARRLARVGGALQEKRMLGVADHCIGCLEEYGKGWQPIGTLRDIGDTPCRTLCHCHFVFK